MPTILFASSKGGVSKSTSAVVLGTQLATHGATVTMIDADPNHPVATWAKRPGRPESEPPALEAVERPELRLGGRQPGHDRLGVVDEHGTRLRQPEPPRRPLEHLAPQLALEGGDLAGHRGLRERECPRRL